VNGRTRVLAALVLATVLAPVAPAAAARVSAPRHTLTVFAAASLTDAFGELGHRFETDHPGVTVRCAFAGSQQLVAQLVAGARADVFAAADTRSMSDARAADVLADEPRIFARNVLVDAGARDGVARGQAGMTGEGLIGRVAEVGERTARILLLSDLNSRIPVVVGASGQHAILAGDNSAEPLLLFLPAGSNVKVGDRVVTGGAQGVFPPDLPVGTVASIDGDTVRVAPSAELARLDYVRIVDLGLSAFLPRPLVPSR